MLAPKTPLTKLLLNLCILPSPSFLPFLLPISPAPSHPFPLPSLPIFLPPLPSPLPQVSLALLTLHEDSLLQCDSMESISEYIKVDIPDTALEHLPYILSYTLKAPPDSL